MASSLRARVVAIGIAASLIGMLAVLVTSLYVPGRHTPISDPDDFRAFFCAGRAVAHGADPYLTEPLRRCEHAAAATFDLGFPARRLISAPLPPYALGLFAIFGSVPFPFASVSWFLVSLLALSLTVVGTARLSGLSALPIAVSCTLAGAVVAINEGQLSPLVAGALVLCAQFARRGPAAGSAAALGLAMIEPHVAVPAVLGALGAPRLRRSLGVALALLIVLDLVCGGPLRTLEYLGAVLPAHASTEVEFLGSQMGLTTTLWGFGVSRAAAQAIGFADYLAMMALGVWVARRLRSRYDDPAFLILVPPAFVLLGGSFIHLFQIYIALPLAYVCFGCMVRQRIVLAFAIVGLSIPTQFIVVNSTLRPFFYPVPRVAANYVAPARDDPGAIAERTEIAQNGVTHIVVPSVRDAWIATLPKIPTWLALIALVFACVREALLRAGETPRRSVIA